MRRLQPYRAVLGVFCLALLVRLTYNLTVGQGYMASYDAQVYEKIALHILQERCFCLTPYMPTTGRAPLWPATIATIYALFGAQNFSVRLFLCAIGAGTCVLVSFPSAALAGPMTGALP